MVPIPENMDNHIGTKSSKARKRKLSLEDSPPKAKNAFTDDDEDNTFNVTSFMSLLVKRESPASLLEGLKTFIKYAEMYPNAPDNVDIVLDFCEISKEGNEILALLKILRIRPSMISTIFNVLQCILIRVADNLVAYKKLASSIAQKLLTVHIQQIYIMLGDLRKSNPVKSTLKLLTAIVVLGENSARNVLNRFDFTNTRLINSILERRNVLDEQDVRTCFIIFLSSFLMTGSDAIIHDFVCKHNVIAKIFAGLRVDKFSLIKLILPLIQEKVVKNEVITKSEKVKVFSADVLTHLARVYNWLGPNKWKSVAQKKVVEFQEVEESPSLEVVRSIVHKLLLDLCTSPKHGVIFFDKTFGNSGRDPNHTMRLFLQDVHVMPYFKDLYLKELVLKIFQVCPEQMQPFLMQIQNSVTPRLSLSWLRCMDFLENILEILPDLPLPLKTSRKIPAKELLDLVQSVVLPPQEILQMIIISVSFTDLLIRHRCLKYTLKLMKKLEAIIQYCTNGTFQSESKVFKKADVEIFTGLFMDHVKRALPPMKTLFYCWQEMDKDKSQNQSAESQRVQDLPEVDLVEHVILIEQILCLCQNLQPEAFSDFPVIEKVFEQVQKKLYQTWKLQQSGAAVIPKESDKVSCQQTRVGLYLLKLLAGTDARKIPWNMKNEDGQPLLYFLLEILLTTASDHHLLSITKQLICQLLFHSGLFDCNEMELHLWIDMLIKWSWDENSKRNEELLKFVASVFTHYICNPHPYIEKIFEVISDASLIEMGADMDIVSTSTVDDFIDRLNELDCEDLELIEQSTEENEGQNSVKLPFSPLIIVAIQETAKKSDAEIKPLKDYLQSVLIDLFHSQTKPIPLGFLLTEERKPNKKHGWISKRIVSYIKSWLPNYEAPRKEKTIDVEEYKNERSTVLLQLFHQNERRLIDDSGFMTLLFKSVNKLNVSETLRAAQQSLLYIQARLSQIEQAGILEDQDLSVLQLIFKYLKKVIKHLFQQCQEQAQSKASLAEGGSEDLDILQIETYTVSRMLSEVLNFVSQQSAIQHWYLAIEHGFVKGSLPLKNDKFKLLRNLVTKELTSVFSEFPKTSNKELLSGYCTKIIAYLNECLLLVSKGRVLDDLAFTVLKHFIPYVDFVTIQESVKLMLQIPADVLLSETTTSGQMLLKLLSYLIQNCKTFQLEENSLLNIYSLLLHSESLDRLLTICKTLFETKPYYCLFCTSEVFVHLLTLASPEHLNLAVILMTYNVALDQAFVQWVLDKNCLKKQNIQNFLSVCITWCKCQKTLPTDQSKKCLAKISKVSCKYLSAWMTENDAESSDTSSNCLQLLHQFARLQAPGYKHMSALDSFKEMVDSNQTMSPSKLKIFLALIQWAESMDDQSVDATRCRIEACLKTFLSSIQARAGAPEDKELESQLLSYLEKYLIDVPPEYNDLILSNWMSFIRNSLRIYYSDCRVLRLVSHLIPKVYTESNSATVSPSLKDLHQMLIGHSNFLSIIMGYESPVSKELLIDILLMVIERQPECCAVGHLYVLMGAYGATLSTCDQKLLKIISLYEKNDIDFAQFRPFLWGMKVIEMYELSKQESTLDKMPSTDRIFELIDSDKMLKSILHFPVKRKLTPLEVAPAEQWKSLECCYDPCFLLPVLSHLLAPYNKLRSLHFMMKNCLGYTFAALSSHDPNMRAAGYHILIRLEEQLKGSSFHRKEQYLYLLQYLRNSVPEENTKLPFVNAIYMMKICQILLNEGHILYSSLTAPLMVKPCQEINMISEFFRLFSSSNLQHYHERMWIQYLLHDGLKESNDYNIYKKYYIFKIIMSFANSVLCNYSSQVQILRILKRACEQKTGAYDLTRHCGIVSWINNFISHVDPHSQIIVIVTEVIHALWFSLLRKNITNNEDDVNKNSFRLPLPFVQEMQVVLLNLLQSYREGTLLAAMKYFLPLFASVLHCKKCIQAQQKEKTSKDQLDQKREESNDSESEEEETDETEIKSETPDNLVTSRVQLRLTPRDVLLVLYQSRLHSSNIQLSERSLDLMERWGYACNHLAEVSHSSPNGITKKSDSNENMQMELPDVCQEEDGTVSSENEENKLQQAFVDICLEWIPSRTFQLATKESDSCFDETLELVMACLCEEAARTVSPSSILNILHWIETYLNLWNFTAANITQNTSQGDIPVLYASLLSLYTRLLSMFDTEQCLSETSGSATVAVSQKSVSEALHLLSKICRTLSERYTSCEVSLAGKPNISDVLLPYLKRIAT